jgi:hypothetical protein
MIQTLYDQIVGPDRPVLSIISTIKRFITEEWSLKLLGGGIMIGCAIIHVFSGDLRYLDI